MTTAYFLTGSYNDRDNEFELKITAKTGGASGSADTYETILTDTSQSGSMLWQTSQPTFPKCLKAMDEYLNENFIVLYSKILASAERDPLIDKELEGFIINHLEL